MLLLMQKHLELHLQYKKLYEKVVHYAFILYLKQHPLQQTLQLEHGMHLDSLDKVFMMP